jgi:hypothetical protein
LNSAVKASLLLAGAKADALLTRLATEELGDVVVVLLPGLDEEEKLVAGTELLGLGG